VFPTLRRGIGRELVPAQANIRHVYCEVQPAQPHDLVAVVRCESGEPNSAGSAEQVEMSKPPSAVLTGKPRHDRPRIPLGILRVNGGHMIGRVDFDQVAVVAGHTLVIGRRAWLSSGA
jgi:hypothetical protein